MSCLQGPSLSLVFRLGFRGYCPAGQQAVRRYSKFTTIAYTHAYHYRFYLTWVEVHGEWGTKPPTFNVRSLRHRRSRPLAPGRCCYMKAGGAGLSIQPSTAWKYLPILPLTWHRGCLSYLRRYPDHRQSEAYHLHHPCSHWQPRSELYHSDQTSQTMQPFSP